jgi:hypothetical protein
MTGPDAEPIWAFDLVHPDAGRRARALAEHHARFSAASDARHHANAVWRDENAHGRDWGTSIAMEAAETRFQRRYQQTLDAWLGPVTESRVRQQDPNTATRDTYRVLFLRWESQFPDEWDRASHYRSRWSNKDFCLRGLADSEVEGSQRVPMQDLVMAALRRRYRCKDWRYPVVARRVDDPNLHREICRFLVPDDLVRAQVDDPLEAAVKAAFLNHVLYDQSRRIKRNSWEQWLLDQQS